MTAKRARSIACAVWCVFVFCVGVGSTEGDSASCAAARTVFSRRGLADVEILDEPVTGGSCSGPGCCGPTTTVRLAIAARREIEGVARTQASRVATTLSARAKRFDELFWEMLKVSRGDFHEMFRRTYGMIYEQHAHLFSGLFDTLELYHRKGGIDLGTAMNDFFAVLYQKMFAVLNSQYNFDEKYLACVSEHMSELQPFGDSPHKLALQVRRAFVATRTFTRALAVAADVARNMAAVRVQPACAAAVGRARHCPACAGRAEKLCPRLCVNLARACLPQHADLAQDWDNFVDAMDKVSDRLIGPFNIANVVEPIDIKISEAIMTFQEHSADLSQKVFTGCGKPVLGQRSSDTAYYSDRRTRSLNKHEGSRYRKSRAVDHSDDFEIETSYESLLKKNPFLLSRGNSRRQLDGGEYSESGVNTKYDTANDLDEYTRKGMERADRMSALERLKTDSRSRREADPEPGKGSKEFEFEPYDFESEERGGNRRKGKKKGGKNKKGGARDPTGVDNDYSRSRGKFQSQPLDEMVKDIKARVRDTRQLWGRLPTVYCAAPHVAEGPANDEHCWNGTHVARYLPLLAGEGSAALATNPSLRGAEASELVVPSIPAGPPAAALLTAQQFTLRSITSKLKEAYNGQDVDWGEDDSALLKGSGSGSGDDTDDRDEVGGPPDQEGDGEEGSGQSIPETPKLDNFVPSQTDVDLEQGFNPSVVIKQSKPDLIDNSDNDNQDNSIDLDNNSIDSDLGKESSGTSGAQEKQEMSLQRALITYLFPIVCVWFGGVISDIA